jgi:MscS family membrane protein
MCHRLLIALAAAFALALLLVAPARATARAQDPAPATQAAGEGFASPEEVVEALLGVHEYERSGDEAALARAASTIAPPGSGLARRESAERLAIRLVRLFDHVAVLDPLRVRDEKVDIDAEHARWTVRPATAPEPVITLGFELRDGSWRLDETTIDSIDGWYTAVEDLPRIAEAAERPLSLTELVRSRVPRRLKGGGFLLEPWQWIGLLLLLLVALLVERAITRFVRPMIRRLGQFEGVALDPELLAKFERPFGWLLLSWLFLAGIQGLDLPTDVYSVLRIAIGLLTTFFTVWSAYCLVGIGCWPLQVRADRTENRFDDMLVPLLRRTLKIVVVIVGFVFLVSRITGDVWHVLAGLSIGSLAIGFAAKDSIENLFGTFTVLMDGPFKIGDPVRVGDIEGSVEQVGFRSTRIRTPEDSLISVPNSRFIASHVDNLGARRSRRVRLVLGLTYDTPPEKIEALCEGIRELIRVHPHTSNAGYHVWLSGFGPSSLDVEVICMVALADHATFLRERHRLYLDVLRLAARLNVAFAFPTQTVWSATKEGTLHPDNPPDSVQAVLRGRAEAKSLTEQTVQPLGKPGLVRYLPDDPDAIVR